MLFGMCRDIQAINDTLSCWSVSFQSAVHPSVLYYILSFDLLGSIIHAEFSFILISVADVDRGVGSTSPEADFAGHILTSTYSAF
jgi:hypothetical protein